MSDNKNNNTNTTLTLNQLIIRLKTGQDVSLDTLKDTLQPYVTQDLGLQVSNAIFEWCTEQDFEGQLVYEDFQEPIDESQVMDDFDGSIKPKKIVYDKIRFLLGIDNAALDWGTNPKFKEHKVLEARRFLNKQTFNSFRANEDKDLMNLMTLGIHNQNPDLVRIIYDVYSQYKVEYQRKNSNKKEKVESGDETKTFFEKSSYILKLPKRQQAMIKEGIKSFTNRVMPMVRLNRSIAVSFIDDDINQYLEYTVMVQEFIHSLLQGKQTICPIQVDLVFMPKKLVAGQESDVLMDMGGLSSEHEDDYDEDDDDDDDDSKEKTLITKPFFGVGADIVNVFKEFNKMLSGGDAKRECVFSDPFEISCDAEARRQLREQFDMKFKQKHSSRYVILIDRRGAEDQCVIYKLPDEYSQIPAQHSFYNCLAATSQYLIPQPKPNMTRMFNKNFGGAKTDNDGQLFVVSFECLQVNQIRMQWFTRGGGVRFHPDYMYRVWPLCFKNMEQLNKKKYNREWLKKVWKLNTLDAEFDRWYATMAPNL